MGENVNVPVYIFKNISDKYLSLNASYTQLMYWQFYADSQYFRETNYEPEIFIKYLLQKNTELQVGVNHQSNGRGGILERSWNRLFAELAVSGQCWLAKLKVWNLIAKSSSSDLHNPDIAKFLGYENLLLSWKIKDVILTAEFQNIESGLKRGFYMLSASYPITNNLAIYGQFFDGYGQSLIEYNHKTKSFGIGIKLNDFID